MEQKQYITPTARLIPIEAEQLLSESVPVENKTTDQMLSKEINFNGWSNDDYVE